MTEYQKAIASAAAKGYRVEVCKGWDAAAERLKNYLGPGKDNPWD